MYSAVYVCVCIYHMQYLSLFLYLDIICINYLYYWYLSSLFYLSLSTHSILSKTMNWRELLILSDPNHCYFPLPLMFVCICFSLFI